MRFTDSVLESLQERCDNHHLRHGLYAEPQYQVALRILLRGLDQSYGLLKVMLLIENARVSLNISSQSYLRTAEDAAAATAEPSWQVELNEA